MTAELLYNLLADVKAQPNTTRVQLFRVFQKAKELEELALILLLYSTAVVNDLDFQSTVICPLHSLCETFLVLECEIVDFANVLDVDSDLPALRSELE